MTTESSNPEIKKFRNRLHLVALPHTQVSPAFCGCAYTAKVLKFCKMMGDDYEIFLYAPEGPAVPGARLISCLSTERRRATFGMDDPSRLPAWPTNEQATLFNNAAIMELRFFSEPHDLVLLTGGLTHKPIADALPHLMCIEPGVGYEGIFTNKCAFESYAWQHYVYGKNGIADGRCFDTVIPNYFDMDDFPRMNVGGGKYLAFLGRLIQRKGLNIAAEISRATGIPLKVAGAGGCMANGKLFGDGVTVEGDIEYLGPVNAAERAEFLAGAKALIVPTTYIEPFGGVAVEAMLCGTPVIASDWGAFVETVAPWTGYRFRTLAQAVRAVKACDNFYGESIRSSAKSNYSLEAVRPQFLRWFDSINSLWQKGWYEL